jgi:hypothetical protein
MTGISDLSVKRVLGSRDTGDSQSLPVLIMLCSLVHRQDAALHRLGPFRTSPPTMIRQPKSLSC